MEQPLPTTSKKSSLFFSRGGEMGQRISEFPWEATSIDVPANWPPALQYNLQTILQSGFPMLLLWGKDLTSFYNDAYRGVLGAEGKHPHILGMPAQKAWPEVWHIIQPLLQKVMEHGETCTFEDLEAPFYRDGKIETVYWTFSYSPVYGDSDKPEGVLVVCTETTRKITRFHNLVQQIKSPLVIYRGPELIIEEANQAILDFWKKDRSVIGKPLAEILPELGEQGFIELLQNVYHTGETFTGREVPSYFKRSNGSKELYYWNLECNAYREGGEITGIVAMATDVTEQVLAKNHLAIAEDEMRVALEAANIGYWHVNPMTNSLRCNRKTKELFGLPPDEEVDLQLALNQIHEEDRQHVVSRIQEALDYSSGGLYDISYRVVDSKNKNVSYVRAIGKTYFNEEQKPYRFSGTVQDISAAKAAEEKLRESEQELRKVKDQLELSIRGGNIGTWHWDIKNDVLQWSPQQEMLYGLQPGSFQGTVSAFKDFILPEDLERLSGQIRERDSEEGSSYSFRIRRTDGAIRWIQNRSKATRNEQGELEYISGINMDVTEEKTIAETLRRSEEKYRGLFENMDQGFCIIEVMFDEAGNGQDYRFLEYNPRFTEQSGLSDAVGKTMKDLVPDIEPYWPQRYGEVVKTGIPIRFSEGSGVMGRWFDVFAFRVGNKEDRKVAVLFTDITERKTAEEKLRKQQQFTENLLEAAPSLTYIYDLVDDGNSFASPQVKHLLGYSAEEVQQMGSNFLPSTMHPDDVPAVQQNLQKLLNDREGEIFTLEYRLQHKQGNWVWLYDRSRVFQRDNDGKPTQLLGVATDITERRLAEEQLHQQQQFTESILQAAPSLTYIFDLLDTSNMFASPQITELLGYAAEEVKAMGSNLLPSLLHPDDVAATNDRFTRILSDATGDIYEVEYRMRHKNGDWIWLFDRARVFRRNEQGTPIQILGVATEITSWKTTEAALRESESRLRTMADTLPQLVWMADADGLVQWQNLRNKEFFGDWYPGLQWMQFLHPDDVERTKTVWDHAVTTGSEYQIEYRFFDKKTDSYRWFLVIALPLRNTEGKIANWFGTCTDIHDQKLMTERLEALVAERTRELQRSNEDLQQFAHVASHDLKEPVRKIRTFINRFEEELGNDVPERGRSYMEKVQRAASRMSAMIDGVLQYSSVDAQQIVAEPVDLNKIIYDVQNDLELSIQQKAATVVCKDLPTIPGSPVLLHQLFYNLVNNSLKFSRAGVAPQIEIYSLIDAKDPVQNGFVKIAVDDNGIGFREQDSERIFGTFIRLHSKDQYEGTGLGLALCQKIVERHSGTIRAEGKEGEGARFVITLPV